MLRARSAGFQAADGTRVAIQVDGELAGELPATVEIVTDSLTLLVPAGLEEQYRLRVH